MPAGWAICDGRKVDRSDGVGRITTPDLRDRVPVGAGGVRQPGDTFGTSQQTTSAAGGHTHNVQVEGSTGSVATGISIRTTLKTETAGGGSDTTVKTVTVEDPGHSHAATLVGTAAFAGRHEHTVDVTQPSIALVFIMKV